MAMTMLFLGLAVVGGTACYFILRRLCWDAWTQWRQGRQEVQEDQRRRLHTQTLHREALDTVLTQIRQQDDQGRKTA